MARAGSEMYAVVDSPASKTSTGTGDIQTFAPSISGKRATGAWISVETTAARMTFDGSAPGAGTGPGLVLPAGGMPWFAPFPFTPDVSSGPRIRFAANAAGSSVVSVIFVQ